MTGIIGASIAEIVNRLDNIRWQSILFEAIANSIQANAKNIAINFITDKNDSLDLKIQPKIIQIAIEDDGDGFTPENIASFQAYLSTYKKHLGCKGMGRFFYLKKFESVYITSLNHEINFVKNANINIEDSDNNYEKTTVYLNKPKEDIIIDSTGLEKNIREHFIADFKLRIDDVIRIVVSEDKKRLFEIKSTENPKFEDRVFNIGVHEFNLSYILCSDMKYDGYYCAGGRVVIKNSQLDPKKKWQKLAGFNIFFLLTSDYLTSKVNDARGDFNIKPKQANHSMLNDLSWEDINSGLTHEIKSIAQEHNINFDDIAQKNLTEARKKSPYLSYYLKSNEEILDVDRLIANAQIRLAEDKEKLRNNKNQINEGNFQRLLNIVTQSELAEYIFDRQRVIEKLRSLTDQKEIEDKLHSLFMPRYTNDESCDYRTNNLWLFDDRFMSYDKIFSEEQIKNIFPQLSGNIKRPDILSIFSNTYDDKEMTDIIIIELKRPNDKISPEGAEGELLKYARYINDLRDNKIRIWTYAFMKFNSELSEVLEKDRGYNKIPVKGGYPIFYKYHPTQNIVINFIDYYAIANDAENRNLTFMKILQGDTL